MTHITARTLARALILILVFAVLACLSTGMTDGMRETGRVAGIMAVSCLALAAVVLRAARRRPSITRSVVETVRKALIRPGFRTQSHGPAPPDPITLCALLI